MRFIAACAFAAFALTSQAPVGSAPYRTLNDRFAPPKFATVEAWKPRAEYLRQHVLASAGLLPLPEKTPLRASVFGEIRRSDYTVSRVYFESLPGFFVTGNLYRPNGDGPFPAILSPHGHWAYGRLENTAINSVPARAINLARQGLVVFTYDMVGYNDSQQVPHTFSGQREYMWGLSLSGLQLWDSIRAIDFLETLPYVRKDAIGMTGESGGGTQTFLAAAADSRIAVAAPVNMISLHMQGGCVCENPPGLRLETTNVEIAAAIAPRPLLMVSATGDWTAETLEVEYPAVRAIYELFGAADRVRAVRISAEHNYNKDSREAMYAWMAHWLQDAPDAERIPERSFTPEPVSSQLVFFQKPLPANAVDVTGLTDEWIASAKRQLASDDTVAFSTALRHSLGFASEGAGAVDLPVQGGSDGPGDRPKGGSHVLLGAADAPLEQALAKAGFRASVIPFTRVDAAAAAKINHFDTYNRTAASQRVADIVAAIRAHPGAALVAGGDAALAGLLASAIVPVPLAVLAVGPFDTSSDADYVSHVYVPGLRRAGDFKTAVAMSRGHVIVHDAGAAFQVPGLRPQAARLSPSEIVTVLRNPPRTGRRRR
jgi:hypothetical protein